MSRSISPPPTKRMRRGRLGENLKDDYGELVVYSWNVNGIAPFIQRPITSFFKSSQTSHKATNDDAHPTSLREFLRRHAWPTILHLQEVKISPEDAATIAAVEKAVRRQDDEDSNAFSYQAHFCLPSDKFNARGFGRKIYGVCSIIRDDYYQRCVQAVRPVSWDNEGRFLVIETKASGDIPKLAMINVYAVNGTDNPYKNPETGEPKGTRHDRKLEVHSLLQAECRKLESEGFRCIIAGDINIARSVIDGYPNLRTFPKQHCANRADFEARFVGAGKQSQDTQNKSAPCLGMVDTFRHLHPDRRGYTYYPRTRKFGDSCDRVDMVLISKGLARSLKGAGIYETPGDRGPSDHVPLYAMFDFQKASKEASE